MDQKQRRSRSAMPKPYRPALGFHHFKHEVVEHLPSSKMGGCQLEKLSEHGMVQNTPIATAG
ncbi:hypothetical protein NKG60_14570 [Mesorhizobium sp. M1428]|uniref:hypothetical protein n=1 Tax=Mesorhizobium sp. M1428 TaxID=2957102 RepID=UPI003338932C